MKLAKAKGDLKVESKLEHTLAQILRATKHCQKTATDATKLLTRDTLFTIQSPQNAQCDETPRCGPEGHNAVAQAKCTCFAQILHTSTDVSTNGGKRRGKLGATAALAGLAKNLAAAGLIWHVQHEPAQVGMTSSFNKIQCARMRERSLKLLDVLQHLKSTPKILLGHMIARACHASLAHLVHRGLAHPRVEL